MTMRLPEVGEAFSLSPAEGERAGVRGKKPSATLRSGELPMESITLSEGKQSSTRAKAPNPWQLQAPFPLTLALSPRAWHYPHFQREIHANRGISAV